MFQYLKNILIILSLLFIPLNIYCQYQANTGQIGDKKIAKKYFEYQDFKDALKEYLLLLKTDSTNIEYNYQIGMCYLLTNIDKKKAIPYLEKVTKQSDVNIFIWYTLGRAYQLAYRFDDAIISFKKFKTLLGQGYDDNYITANRQIQMCYNAKKMIENPVNVNLENLGPNFNSPYPDYYPFVPEDESFIIFTSKRKGNIGGLLDYDGFYTSDIYMSELKNCNWKKPKSINTVNSELVEECIGLSQNGENLLIFADNYIATSEVLSSKKNGKNFQQPITLGKYLKSYMITSASVTNDNNILFFASDKQDDNHGGKDIFMSKKLPNGEWGLPDNLGNTINTIYDEDFPNISSDGKTLYFSSLGHNSMGGFDLFKSLWNEKTKSWSKPVNLGYPINTPDDNYTISFSKSGRYAYISECRENGMGNLDIYRVTFNDAEPKYTPIKGTILNTDSVNIFLSKLYKTKNDNSYPDIDNNQISVNKFSKSKININKVKKNRKKEIEINITVTNKKNNKIIGHYKPNNLTGNYILLLPPGKFTIIYKGKKFQEYKEDIEISDYEMDICRQEIIKNVILTPVIDD